MNALAEALKKNMLFRNKTEQEITGILAKINPTLRNYSRNEHIVREAEPAERMGIVITGIVEVQKMYSTGKVMTVSRFSTGSTVGEAVIFSKTNTYPATVIAAESASVLMFTKKELLALFALDTEIMALFMQNMSERLILLNQRIEILSLGTLRQRIAHFLIKEMKQQKTERIRIPFNKRVWAEHLNSARPSLSRELCYMRDQGWITFDDSTVDILQVGELEGLLQ
ncbi:Crp/Fnr family transcriptional regulator [Paenibacillus mesotrionivorans]|jgi:CRP-like cAMP-binding protein|uniref:Crp/Fnr family transcriptional regulator n=1 Tax=Paenibacillus mesotrionivorans TaxID=3160968 RepID=A0ACC7P4M0_9BACL